MEKYRIIKTGLRTQKDCDILDGVFAQLSDGLWENSPASGGYWPYIDAELENGEVVLKVSNAYRKYDEPTNKLLDMTDEAVKKWLAKKIKQVIQEEGLDWDRGNEEPTDFLDTSWRKSKKTSTVADCYYVYEVLKGRNVAKHPEYNSKMSLSKAIKILGDNNMKIVDDEPWELDESVGRGPVVKLMYRGTDLDIKERCRKVFSDEELAKYPKLLRQEYVYDLIRSLGSGDVYDAEDTLIKRNQGIIDANPDDFYIEGPNFKHMIS